MSYKNIIVVGNGGGVLEKENGHLIDTFDYVVRMGNCNIRGFERYVGTKTDMYRAQWCNFIHFDKNEQFFIPRYDHIKFNHLLFSEIDPDIYVEYASIAQDVRRFTHFVRPAVHGDIFKNANLGKYERHRGVRRVLHDILLCYFVQKCNISDVRYITRDDFIAAHKEVNKSPNRDRIFLPSNGILTIFYLLRVYPSSKIYITGFDGFKTRYYWTTGVETSFRSHNSLSEQILLKKLLKQEKIYEL